MPDPVARLTVLLVDPQADTRKLAAFMLERQGYRVLEARNGLEAVEIFGQQASGVDLLLSEIAMYKMTGPKLAEKLRESQPGLRVLLMSATPREGCYLLKKPFTNGELREKVQQALETPKTMAAGTTGLT